MPEQKRPEGFANRMINIAATRLPVYESNAQSMAIAFIRGEVPIDVVIAYCNEGRKFHIERFGNNRESVQ